MSSITDYFERFILAAAILETRTQDLSKAASFIAIGLGMVLFGITKLRSSPWRLPMLIAELALWFGGVYWLLHTML
jgi:hypothetical protein